MTVKWIFNIRGCSTMGGLVAPLGSPLAAISSPPTMVSRASQPTSASPLSNSRLYFLVKEGVETHLLWILLANQHPARPWSDRVSSVVRPPPREVVSEQFPNNKHSLDTSPVDGLSEVSRIELLEHFPWWPRSIQTTPPHLRGYGYSGPGTLTKIQGKVTQWSSFLNGTWHRG